MAPSPHLHSHTDPIQPALTALQQRGIAARTNVPMPSGRLIQLVVECGNAIAPVEIRPFTSWQPTTAPAQRALRHVTEDQAWLAAACGFLWLPYAHGSWPLRPFGRRTGLVSVAFGSPHALTRAIAHRMHQPRT